MWMVNDCLANVSLKRKELGHVWFMCENIRLDGLKNH